jgi:hypothetical protein
MQSIDAYMEVLLDDALHGFDTADEFYRILAVLPAARRPGHGPALRTGPRISQQRAQQRVTSTTHGVFLDGASLQQARQWAQSLARRLRGTVVYDPPGQHGGTSRPHFHVTYPGGRTGHIFYGRRPSSQFFDR